MSLRERGPYKVECLGHTLRIIDKDGGDVCLVGDAQDGYNQELADFIIQQLNSDNYNKEAT